MRICKKICTIFFYKFNDNNQIPLGPGTPASPWSWTRRTGWSSTFTRWTRWLYDPIAVKILRQNLNCFWPLLVQKCKNPHYNNLFIFRSFSKIISMRIFVFLNIFCRQKIPFWRKLMVFYFFMFRIFFKNYTHAVFHFFVVFFTSKKSVCSAKNENSENAQNAENSHQNFDCYGVIQQCRTLASEPSRHRCVWPRVWAI